MSLQGFSTFNWCVLFTNVLLLTLKSADKTRDLATQFIVGYDIPCMLYETNFRLYT